MTRVPVWILSAMLTAATCPGQESQPARGGRGAQSRPAGRHSNSQPASRPARQLASRPAAPPKLEAALQAACTDLDLARVRTLLDQGAVANAADAEGQPALITAIRAIRRQEDQAPPADLVAVLLEHGADLERPDGQGLTPLMAAAQRHAPAIITLLLKHGAKLNATDHQGRTAVMYAAQTRNEFSVSQALDCLQGLLDAGANINDRDTDGLTPLHLAVSQFITEAGGMVAHPEIVAFLLAHGADVNAADKKGETALLKSAAVWSGPPQVAKLLLEKGADITARDADGRNALMRAIRPNNVELISQLLSRKMDLTLRDRASDSALRIAIDEGQQAIVQILLEFGADPRSADCENAEAVQKAVLEGELFHAAEKDNAEAIESLLKQGASVQARDRQGRTVLHRLANGYSYSQNDRACEVLLKNGADITARDAQGNTPLILAAGHTHRDMVRQLLEKGADPNIRNYAGMTALLVAAEQSDHVATPLLLQHGADVKARTPDGQTALHLAALHYLSTQVAGALLNSSAEVDALDDLGRTPLMRAADAASLDLVELLLHHHADINARDKSGQSVLGHARAALAKSDVVPADHDSLEQIIALLQRNHAAE